MAKKGGNDNQSQPDLFSLGTKPQDKKAIKTEKPAPVRAVKTQMAAVKAEPRVYSVRQLNAMVKVALESHLPGFIAVVGELSNFKCHSSGHCYFSLKDDASEIACVMWNSAFRKLKFKPVDGMAVILKGKVDVFLASGKYQFYAESIEPQGTGALQLAFEQMVKKLEAAGFFDPAHKKKLPPFATRIGVITSESGAALHDIADSIFTRWPPARLFLYPVPVQGEGAAGAIATAIEDVNRRQVSLRLDVVIVGRGGGSIEDLWAFNEEVVARAIYNSKIPIISAVGHEVDTTISDLVADARAATPTKAAILAVPDGRDAAQRLDSVGLRLTTDALNRLRMGQGRLDTVLAAALFRNPLGPVLASAQALDEAGDRLASAVRRRVGETLARMGGFYEKIIQIEPHRLLGAKTLALAGLENRMVTSVSGLHGRCGLKLEQAAGRCDAAVKSTLNRAAMELTGRANRLEALNPKSVLGRGYSIVRAKKNGQVVTRPEAVDVGDVIVTEFAGEKSIESRVEGK